MLEHEIKNIWNSSSQGHHISIETNQLITELNAKVDNIQKKIKNRDIREISASVIGILIWAYLLYEIPFPITKAASTLSILWFVFVIFKFRTSKKQNTITEWSLSMKKQLAHQKSLMQHQSALLKTAAYWYSMPSFIINIIFIMGLGSPADYNWTNGLAENILPLTTNMKIITISGLALFYAFTVWLNKRALDKEVNPLLGNINTLQKQLKNEW